MGIIVKYGLAGHYVQSGGTRGGNKIEKKITHKKQLINIIAWWNMMIKFYISSETNLIK